MKNIVRRATLLQRLLAVSAGGLLLASQAVVADNTAPGLNQNQSGQGQAVDFEEADANNDNMVDWHELNQAYDGQVPEIDLTEDQLMQEFDLNQDNQLDQTEYHAFTSGVIERQEYSAAEINQQGSQTTQEQQPDQDQAVAADDQFGQDQATDQDMQPDPQTEQDQGMAAGGQSEEAPARDQDIQQGQTDQDQAPAADDQFGQDQATDQDMQSDPQTEQDQDMAAGDQSDEAQARDQDIQQGQTDQGQPAITDEQSGQDQATVQGTPQDSQQDPQQDQTEQHGDGTVEAVVVVTEIQRVPVVDIAEREVVNLEDEKIGEVENVVMSRDGSETGLVVSTGGFLGLGGKDVVIDVNEVHLTGERVVWEQTSDDDEAADQLPEYNEDEYISIQ